MAPAIRRRRRVTLSAEDRQAIVARYDAGETWKDIGRDYRMQDQDLKRIYQSVKQRTAACFETRSDERSSA